MTVALSRARLGLYILGRRTVFEACHELKEAFNRLTSERSDKLTLVTHEMYGGTSRRIDEEVEGTEMTGVEHLGQYVFEMTKAKLDAATMQGKPLVAMDQSETAQQVDDGADYGAEEEADEIDGL